MKNRQSIIGHLEGRQPGIWDLLGQADVEVESERGGQFLLEELPQAAVARIDPAQQLAFIKSQANGVISLPHARFPGWFLPRHDASQPVEVGDDALIHRFIEGKQGGLVREQLPDGDLFFALLGKLRPVRADAFLVIKQAPRMRQRHGQAGQALGGGVHTHHRLLFPGVAGGLVADAAPQVHDFFPLVVDATGCSQLVPPGEVLDERCSYGLKSRLDKTRYRTALYLGHDIAPYRCTIHAPMTGWFLRSLQGERTTRPSHLPHSCQLWSLMFITRCWRSPRCAQMTHVERRRHALTHILWGGNVSLSSISVSSAK